MEDKPWEKPGLFKAKELEISQWIDAEAKHTDPIYLSDYPNKFKVIFCFQYWCKGCHTKGFPTLIKMIQEKQHNNDIVFLAIQTVFEGHKENSFENMVAIQKEYGLKIPFGHDAGDASTNNISKTMLNYRTEGTPWFILINEKNRVVFSDFI
ncbi:peroxiredoxin [Oceanihabitans sediminis]|uniref:TlpA family protein disulfide reductase n=1 Tax=Oceanihabitans sediminis TaxID=1812012 RepID=A0A368P2E1_9FLAO|nr:redoxin family protein [Oceanihabitans sediminis]MDX1277888.1 redoxin family protein [Oceanihabitans sediminis]MDX1774503.1 redoxin family protein [Oceanihabitans sediminis]RBP27790.1 redoxin [Oceanihabitans sediminis]RCU56573.1 TlpA family protein disulfide reductase [Oceanihabitans sediminis]